MANYLGELEGELRDAPRRSRAVMELLASWNGPGGLDHCNACTLQTIVNDLHDGLNRLEAIYEKQFDRYQKDRAAGRAA